MSGFEIPKPTTSQANDTTLALLDHANTLRVEKLPLTPVADHQNNGWIAVPLLPDFNPANGLTPREKQFTALFNESAVNPKSFAAAMPSFDKLIADADKDWAKGFATMKADAPKYSVHEAKTENQKMGQAMDKVKSVFDGLSTSDRTTISKILNAQPSRVDMRDELPPALRQQLAAYPTLLSALDDFRTAYHAPMLELGRELKEADSEMRDAGIMRSRYFYLLSQNDQAGKALVIRHQLHEMAQQENQVLSTVRQ